MMELSSYLGFVLVSAAQVATPGPSTLFLVNNALSMGRFRALFPLSGDLVAIALLASLSITGLAGLLASHPAAFLALRVAGAAYVLWLGWNYLRPAPPMEVAATSARPSEKNDLGLWLRSFGVGISNPKAVLFFAALFPQFVPAGSGKDVLVLMVLTFVMVKFLVLGGYALGARQVGRLLRKPGHARLGRMLTGIVFLVFGTTMIWSAFADKA